MDRGNEQSGFTLVELVVSVMIASISVGVAMSIMAMAWSKSIDTARLNEATLMNRVIDAHILDITRKYPELDCNGVEDSLVGRGEAIEGIQIKCDTIKSGAIAIQIKGISFKSKMFSLNSCTIIQR